MALIQVPANGWRPRPYQRPLWDYLENGGKRAIAIWHRRAGKDEVILHRMCVSMIEKPATYWHMLPEATQARKAIWNAVNPHTGIRRIDEAFPAELRETTRDQDMFIRLKNGATLNIVGSDNYNSLVGSPPYGVVFSEWALANPAAWAYVSPILRENGGWAAFITTPRGKNHAHSMLEMARQEGWFNETLRADQTNVFSEEGLASEKRELIGLYGIDLGTAMFEQEYLVSFDAAVMGSYWGAEMALAERDGRITSVPVNPSLPVHTAWDLGHHDATVIWFFQMHAGEIRVVDYYASNTKSLQHYAAVVISKGYRRGDDWVPHDAKVHELGTGRSRVETMIQAGLKPRLVPDHSREDGINAARLTIGRTWFDAANCRDGIEALKAYRREWDDKLRRFRDTPLHDWSSDPADAFRYLSMAWRELVPTPPPPGSRMLSVGPRNEITMDDLWSPGQRPGRRI